MWSEVHFDSHGRRRTFFKNFSHLRYATGTSIQKANRTTILCFTKEPRYLKENPELYEYKREVSDLRNTICILGGTCPRAVRQTLSLFKQTCCVLAKESKWSETKDMAKILGNIKNKVLIIGLHLQMRNARVGFKLVELFIFRKHCWEHFPNWKDIGMRKKLPTYSLYKANLAVNTTLVVDGPLLQINKKSRTISWDKDLAPFKKFPYIWDGHWAENNKSYNNWRKRMIDLAC